jgi:aspartyl-tRNA(Asn)/glutamyl-tRNA(Gln) amidotransferase subunit A
MTGTAELPPTIAAAGEWLRRGRITAQALTAALLARAHAAQAALGAFVAITDEAALAAARAADADFARGVDRGPLQGVPLGIKDLIATADAPTTANSRVLDPAWGQRADATVVRRLRAAGAVLLGKLALHEFATGWPDPATGLPVVRNPWDVARTPGGSSSGTGAAVAAGLVLGGLGTDTSGSIRGPSAYCGVSGLKPTFGRVSKEGCVPLGYSLDNIGPMARTARDCALLLQTLAGYDPADPCSVAAPLPEYAAALDGALTGVRVGLPRAYFFDTPELDGEVRAAVLAAAEVMAAAGARIVDVALPSAAAAAAATTVTIRAESYAYHERDLRLRPALYGRHTRQVLQLGLLFTAADFVQAQRVRSLLREECATALAAADVLLTPTMPGPAGAFAGYDPDARIAGSSFTGLWNLAGLPALSVPCGFTAAGLPVGLQLVGRPFAEALVLKVGDAYQRLSDWHTRTPPPPPAVVAPPGEPVRHPPPGERQPAVDRLLEGAGLGAGSALEPGDRDRLHRVYPAVRALADGMRTAPLDGIEPALIYHPAGVRSAAGGD